MRVRYRLDDGSVAVSEFDSLEYSKHYEQATFYNSNDYIGQMLLSHFQSL